MVIPLPTSPYAFYAVLGGGGGYVNTAKEEILARSGDAKRDNYRISRVSQPFTLMWLYYECPDPMLLALVYYLLASRQPPEHNPSLRDSALYVICWWYLMRAFRKGSGPRRDYSYMGIPPRPL